MREQVELTFIIGYNKQNHPQTHTEFKRKVIEAACRLCGGCTVVKSDGYWAADGAMHKQEFGGKVEQEYCLHIKLSCELAKEARVHRDMTRSIAAFAVLYGIDTEWVHVQRSCFTGLHFNVKDVYHCMSRTDYRDIVSPGTRYAHK